METLACTEQSVRGARGLSGRLAVCPHCGGNVRRVRDVYGAYCQCLQCSREVAVDAALEVHGVATRPGAEELLVA